MKPIPVLTNAQEKRLESRKHIRRAIIIWVLWLAAMIAWRMGAIPAKEDTEPPCTVFRDGACLTRSTDPAVQAGKIEGWECTKIPGGCPP